MRLNSTNNQFLFNLPIDFISKEVEIKLQKFMDKNWIPYTDPISYLNSTIKELRYPDITYDSSEQTIMKGKKIEWKPATNRHDTYSRSLDITFRSIDSHSNYFMLQQIFAEYYNNTRKQYLPWLQLNILDKDGDIIYTIILRSCLLKSISDIRMMYQGSDVSEQTFTVTFDFLYIDIYWELSDIPNYKKVNIYDTESWDHTHEILPMTRKQNNY